MGGLRVRPTCGEVRQILWGKPLPADNPGLSIGDLRLPPLLEAWVERLANIREGDKIALGCSFAADRSYGVVSVQVVGSVGLLNPSVPQGGLPCGAGDSAPLLPLSFVEPTLDGTDARREATPYLLSHVRGREQCYHFSPPGCAASRLKLAQWGHQDTER